MQAVKIALMVPTESVMLSAHFPGHPILPGAALLDMVLNALKLDRVQNTTVKFLQPVRPGDRLELQTSPLLAPATGLKFEVRRLMVDQGPAGGQIVCTGQLRL